MGKISDHTDIISSGALFAVNSAVLTARCFPKNIPSIIPRVGQSLLSFTGIIFLNLQVKDLSKCFRDTKLALQAKDVKSFFYSALKVALKAMEIFLTLTTFAATIFALINYGACALAIYAALTPLALPSILLPLSFDVTDYFATKKLLTKVNLISTESGRRISNYVESILKEKKNFYSCSAEEKKLGRHIIQQLDPFALSQVKKNVSFSVLKSSLKTRLTLATADLGLRGFGYVGMGVNRRYPGSVAQAQVNWQISTLYTGRLIWGKWQACRDAKKNPIHS